jgi:4-diphosphocytidyl-2-C-methyl-D-erythritol kinase
MPARADGYHGIESIFQTIPFYDKLALQRTGDSGSKCHVICNGMVLPEKNTLTSAYEVFCEVTDVSESATIYLEKNIPSGAGLGGGSSDAASLINALDAVYGTGLSLEQKRYIASKVGSDVFFFTECNDVTVPFAALVSGRGEIVDPIIPRRDLFFVLICPDVHSSTGEAYRLVDQWNEPNWNWNGYSAEQLEGVYSKPVESWDFVNSFTAPLVQQYPLIGEGLQDLKDVGASFVQMSGSGSTVFGIFCTKDSAACAFLKLRKKWKRCYTFAFS